MTVDCSLLEAAARAATFGQWAASSVTTFLR
jgi:hypothetical protein